MNECCVSWLLFFCLAAVRRSLSLGSDARRTVCTHSTGVRERLVRSVPQNDELLEVPHSCQRSQEALGYQDPQWVNRLCQLLFPLISRFFRGGFNWCGKDLFVCFRFCFLFFQRKREREREREVNVYWEVKWCVVWCPTKTDWGWFKW